MWDPPILSCFDFTSGGNASQGYWIVINFDVITVGGNDQKESEKFDVNQGPESALFTSPDLYYYYDYPEIFVVPQDFCQ